MSVARLLSVPALLLAVPATARITDPYNCGGGIKLQNLNKMKRDRALEAIRDAERSTLDNATGTTLTTERLERYKQGLGWFGIGAVHPGTFEYHLDYDAAGSGQFTLAVRDFYGPLAPGDLTLSTGSTRVTLTQRSANAVETDTVRENWSGANGYNMSQQLNRFYVSRYAITRADMERLAAADPSTTVLTDQAIGRFGERQCKLSLFPLEFRYLLDAISAEERGKGT